MATNIIQGSKAEWALLQRHASEDIFGVQICGAFANSMSRCTQVLCDTCDIDFIDINLGCPIDMVFNMVSVFAELFIGNQEGSFYREPDQL